jgi:hypothetical protein
MKGYNISIENPDIKIANSRYFETIENILNNYPVNLTLDVEHAKNDLKKFLTPEIIPRISEIHYSKPNPSFNHDCYSAGFKRFDEIIKAIKLINKPIIIEVDLKNYSQLNDGFIDESRNVIFEEIELLQKNLTSF